MNEKKYPEPPSQKEILEILHMVISHGEKMISLYEEINLENNSFDFHSNLTFPLMMMGSIAKYREWAIQIPFIKFDPDWEIAIIPPFAGAMARFRVRKGEAEISIYLDCYNLLGIYDGPYWEIFPYEKDTCRVAMEDVDELVKEIRHAIENYK